MRPLTGLVVGTCLMGMACAQSTQAPTAPGAVATTVGGATSPAAHLGDFNEPVLLEENAPRQPARGGRASGHAEVQGNTVNNVREERYSFTAIPDGEAPRAKGEVEAHLFLFTGEEVVVHAAVTCVSVVGNTAWVGSRVTREVYNGEKVDFDLPMVFQVRDNGEGAATVDDASLVFFGTDDLTYCDTRPSTPRVRPTTTGNVQVKPE